LRASCDLAQLLGDGDRIGEAVALLAPVYATFAEGFGFPDLVEVRMLLGELGAPLVATRDVCPRPSEAVGQFECSTRVSTILLTQTERAWTQQRNSINIEQTVKPAPLEWYTPAAWDYFEGCGRIEFGRVRLLSVAAARR